MENEKKVLIVTGTPFRDDTNNGKTLRVLFSKFKSEELAQIYFSPSSPNVFDCCAYYQVHEKQLIKSFFGASGKTCGGVVFCDLESKTAERYEQRLISKKDKDFMRFLRELLWDISYWKNRQLKKWIDEVNPGMVFAFFPKSKRSAKFFKWLAKRYQCEVVMLVTDDHYHDQQEHPSVLRRGIYRRLHKALHRATQCSKIILGCSELTAKEYGKLFNLPSEAVFTPSGEQFLEMPFCSQENETVVFRFFGNIELQRWKVLQALGEAIKEYNGNQCKAKLEIYSSYSTPEILEALTIPNACEFKGFVRGQEFLDLLQSADVAVHVESFDSDMVRKTRLSISTKIADYLGAGKCIMAIGPEILASVDHISPVSYVINDLSNLHEAVQTLCSNRDLRIALQEKARALANESHNIEKIGLRMREILLGE